MDHGQFTEFGFHYARDDHSEIVACRWDRLTQAGVPLPPHLRYIRRCEQSLQKELRHTKELLKRPRNAGVECGSVECRVLGRPEKERVLGDDCGKVFLFGGRPHVMLARTSFADDGVWLACSSLDAIKKVRCGDLVEEDLAEVRLSERDVEDPMSDGWASAMQSKHLFQEALDRSPEEARALRKVAEWWARLHPQASEEFIIDLIPIYRMHRRFDPEHPCIYRWSGDGFEADPWRWPREKGEQSWKKNFHSAVDSDTLVWLQWIARRSREIPGQHETEPLRYGKQRPFISAIHVKNLLAGQSFAIPESMKACPLKAWPHLPRALVYRWVPPEPSMEMLMRSLQDRSSSSTGSGPVMASVVDDASDTASCDEADHRDLKKRKKREDI